MILHFFNDLALEGIDKLEDMGGIIPTNKRLEKPLLMRAFNKAGVFSVWRPTSNDAIKKMMTGEGVCYHVLASDLVLLVFLITHTSTSAYPLYLK